jgi:hypothetical protein
MGRFETMHSPSCRWAECCILVYGAIDLGLFEDIPQCRKNFCRAGKPSENGDFAFMSLATKSRQLDKVILPGTAKAAGKLVFD